MSHSEHRFRQQAILEAALAVLCRSDHVLGVLLAGSYSRGDNDAFSDIDVGCYLRDEAKTGRKQLYDAVGALRPMLCNLWVYDKHALFLYENGVLLDLDFLSPTDLADATHVYSNARIVHDPDGTLAEHLPEILSAKPAAHPQWFDPGSTAFLEWFFWTFRQVVCWSLRSAQGGERAFDKLFNAVNSLAEARTRLKEMRLWTIGRQDYLERVDATCAEKLAASYPHFDPHEVIESAGLLLAEYERIAPDYCKKAGVQFPSDKLRATASMIEEFVRLSAGKAQEGGRL